MPIKKFITFCAGDQNFSDAGKRIITQAKNINLFNDIILYTDLFLKNDQVFWNNHSKFIENNKKGYGYWLWKPYIIKKTLEKMNDEDILLYLDCGCELNYLAKIELENKIKIVKNKKIIGSSACNEREYTKKN